MVGRTMGRRLLVLGEDGHVGTELAEVLLLPQGGDGLGLRVELDARLEKRAHVEKRSELTCTHIRWSHLSYLAVEMRGTNEGTARAGEGEEGKRHRDRNVDADLAHINLVLVLAGSSTRASKNSGACRRRGEELIIPMGSPGVHGWRALACSQAIGIKLTERWMAYYCSLLFQSLLGFSYFRLDSSSESGDRATREGGECTVAVRVLVDETDGIIEGIDTQAKEDRSEDLLLVAGHVRSHVREDSRADEIALRELGHLNNKQARNEGTMVRLPVDNHTPTITYGNAAAVQHELSTLVNTTLDKAVYALQRFFGDDRTEVRARREA